jgi:hypothetical protein
MGGLYGTASSGGHPIWYISAEAMHSARELRSSLFEVAIDGRPAGIEELFEGFDELDRLGVVLSEPCGAVGASALITAAITAFYDRQRERGPDFFIYPDYFLFHLGRPLGDHARLDIWPRRKEVVVEPEPEQLLAAINDRGITRLVVEDGEPGDAPLEPDTVASARARICSCLAYSPSGRVRDADVRIASNPVTEGYVEAVLDPETRMARLRAEGDGGEARADAIAVRAGEVEPQARRRIAAARADLLEDGVPVETYRRIELDEALGLLG